MVGSWRARIWFDNGSEKNTVFNEIHLYQHLQRGAKWFLKGVNSPSLRV